MTRRYRILDTDPMPTVDWTRRYPLASRPDAEIDVDLALGAVATFCGRLRWDHSIAQAGYHGRSALRLRRELGHVGAVEYLRKFGPDSLEAVRRELLWSYAGELALRLDPAKVEAVLAAWADPEPGRGLFPRSRLHELLPDRKAP